MFDELLDKVSNIREGVHELIGEVPGIDKMHQKILHWALNAGVISNVFPPSCAKDVDAEVAYLKDVLLPKALEVFHEKYPEPKVVESKEKDD